jgi:hypothetical protein
MGISEKQSRQWQKLGEVPADLFNAALKDKTAMPTTNGIIRAAAEPAERDVGFGGVAIVHSPGRARDASVLA